MRMYARFYLPVLPALLLTGCVDFGDLEFLRLNKEIFQNHNGIQLAARGTVSIETFNVSVELMGWERTRWKWERNQVFIHPDRGSEFVSRIDVQPRQGGIRCAFAGDGRRQCSSQHGPPRSPCRVRRQACVNLIAHFQWAYPRN